MDIAECCSRCESNQSSTFSPRDLALTGCLSFVAGVAFVCLIFYTIKMKREKKMCFKKKEEPFRGKFEGASKKATFQVLKKHTLERSTEIEKSAVVRKSEQEIIESPESSRVTITESNIKTKANASGDLEEINRHGVVHAENENEASEKVLFESEKKPDESEICVTMEGTLNDKVDEHDEDVNEDAVESDITMQRDRTGLSGDSIDLSEDKTEFCRDRTNLSSHLYEKSRGSSVYEHEDLVLQNANFRMSALSNI